MSEAQHNAFQARLVERTCERVDAWRYWTACLFRNGRGNQEKRVAGTLWAAYNAVTELVDHSGGRFTGVPGRPADNLVIVGRLRT